MGDKVKLVQIDPRGRLTLGGFAKHRLYRAEIDAGGVIVMTPVEIVDVKAQEEQDRG